MWNKGGFEGRYWRPVDSNQLLLVVTMGPFNKVCLSAWEGGGIQLRTDTWV